MSVTLQTDNQLPPELPSDLSQGQSDDGSAATGTGGTSAPPPPADADLGQVLTEVVDSLPNDGPTTFNEAQDQAVNSNPDITELAAQIDSTLVGEEFYDGLLAQIPAADSLAELEAIFNEAMKFQVQQQAEIILPPVIEVAEVVEETNTDEVAPKEVKATKTEKNLLEQKLQQNKLGVVSALRDRANVLHSKGKFVDVKLQKELQKFYFSLDRKTVDLERLQQRLQHQRTTDGFSQNKNNNPLQLLAKLLNVKAEATTYNTMANNSLADKPENEPATDTSKPSKKNKPVSPKELAHANEVRAFKKEQKEAAKLANANDSTAVVATTNENIMVKKVPLAQVIASARAMVGKFINGKEFKEEDLRMVEESTLTRMNCGVATLFGDDDFVLGNMLGNLHQPKNERSTAGGQSRLAFGSIMTCGANNMLVSGHSTRAKNMANGGVKLFGQSTVSNSRIDRVMADDCDTLGRLARTTSERWDYSFGPGVLQKPTTGLGHVGTRQILESVV